MNALADEHANPKLAAPDRCREIRRGVEGSLRRSGYFALRDVSCDVRDGVLFLDGRLPSYYIKQVAQYLAYQVEGVRSVVNRIEVIAPGRTVAVGSAKATTHCDGVN